MEIERKIETCKGIMAYPAGGTTPVVVLVLVVLFRGGGYA
jgi:hypothetical protein